MRVVYITENAYIVISFANRAVGAAWPVMDEMGKRTHFCVFLLCVGVFSPFHSTSLEETELSALLCSLVSCWDSHYYSIVQVLLLMIGKKWQSFHLPRPRWPLTPRIFIQAQTHRCTPLPSRPHLCFCLSVVCFCSILPFTSSAKFSSLLKSSPISIHRPCVRFPSSPAGLDSARIRQAGQIAGQSSSRRLGDYRVKFNYNEIDVLRWSRKKHKICVFFLSICQMQKLEKDTLKHQAV